MIPIIYTESLEGNLLSVYIHVVSSDIIISCSPIIINLYHTSISILVSNFYIPKFSSATLSLKCLFNLKWWMDIVIGSMLFCLIVYMSDPTGIYLCALLYPWP